MDEYINRKDAEEALAEYRMSLTMSQFPDMETCIESRGIVEGAMNVIAGLPTADVVPKSEYDDLKFQFEALDHECDRLEAAESRRYDAIVEAKSEVAREIFEEIEKYVEVALMNGHIETPILCIGYGTFAELKKKYTEVNV